MSGYTVVPLNNLLISEIGEPETQKLLSDFSCPLNLDVEEFLHHKAIVFEKQGIARTQLVYASYRGAHVLVGYFSLANKFLSVRKSAITSSTWQKRISKFAHYDRDQRRYILSAPLIGQLGKNYSSGYDKLITGDELLTLAIDEVRKAQHIIGGRVVYLECEDRDRLKDFYTSNGFICFGKRTLDRDETKSIAGEYLLQMLKYL